MPGAGPDVISTLWGMWWAGQVGLLPATGSATELVNVPYGATGAVLSPMGAAAWMITAPLLGPARAAGVVAWLTVAGLAAGIGWLATRVWPGIGAWGALAAVLLALSSRYLFFGVGEGSPVAVAALPLPLGLGALLAARREQWLAAPLAALMMAWTAAENPYLAPVLPAVTLLLWAEALLRGRDGRPLLLALLGGAAGGAGGASLCGRAALLGQSWAVVDLPWARATPADLLWPGRVQWTLSATDAEAARGGRYLGWSGLLLGLGSLATPHRRRAAPWLLLAGVGVALSLGSLLTPGLAGPFLLLNGFMDAVARPLTQPTRFLVLVLIGLGVAAAYTVTELRSRLGVRAVVGVLLLMLGEGIAAGGLGLRLPQTALPPADACLTVMAAAGGGGVLLWPWDGVDLEQSTAQLYQIRHGLPTPQTGIASWAQSEAGRAADEVRGAGWAPGRVERLNINKLLELGYRWAIVDAGVDPVGGAQVAAKLAVPPQATCAGGQGVFSLVEAAPSWPGPRPSHSKPATHSVQH